MSQKKEMLYIFLMGFQLHIKNITGVIPPIMLMFILVAPKGSGTSVRRNFLAGAGINSSYSVFQILQGKLKNGQLH